MNVLNLDEMDPKKYTLINQMIQEEIKKENMKERANSRSHSLISSLNADSEHFNQYQLGEIKEIEKIGKVMGDCPFHCLCSLCKPAVPIDSK